MPRASGSLEDHSLDPAGVYNVHEFAVGVEIKGCLK
jgi:hypothetical protein